MSEIEEEGETQSKYTSWGWWKGENILALWKPQRNEKLSLEAQETAENRGKEREVEGRDSEGFYWSSLSPVWQMDGWNQSPI